MNVTVEFVFVVWAIYQLGQELWHFLERAIDNGGFGPWARGFAFSGCVMWVAKLIAGGVVCLLLRLTHILPRHLPAWLVALALIVVALALVNDTYLPKFGPN